MRVIVLGAGIIGVCTAWHLLERGHDVKALKWMLRKDAPLLFRPQCPLGEGWQQWRWRLQFLAQCNDAASERNVQQLVALGAFSHAALKDLAQLISGEAPQLNFDFYGVKKSRRENRLSSA